MRISEGSKGILYVKINAGFGYLFNVDRMLSQGLVVYFYLIS